jgi:hypothetical protein
LACILARRASGSEIFRRWALAQATGGQLDEVVVTSHGMKVQWREVCLHGLGSQPGAIDYTIRLTSLLLCFVSLKRGGEPSARRYKTACGEPWIPRSVSCSHGSRAHDVSKKRCINRLDGSWTMPAITGGLKDERLFGRLLWPRDVAS